MLVQRLERQAPIETRPLRATTLPRPEPGPGQIRIRVTACGVCRTDLHVIEGDLRAANLPLVPGHQVVGVVDSLGAGVSRYRPGDRVGVAWLRGTCGACGYCATGRENLCGESVYTGYHRDGGYAEAAVVREDFAYAIPAGFDDAEAAPLLCAGIIGYRALKRADLPPGGRLLLVGFGSSAHVVLQSVEANTRVDGRELLQAATEIPIRPKVTRFPLSEANEALIALKSGRIDGSGVLVMGGR